MDDALLEPARRRRLAVPQHIGEISHVLVVPTVGLGLDLNHSYCSAVGAGVNGTDHAPPHSNGAACGTFQS
jgi:hypothetical protein